LPVASYYSKSAQYWYHAKKVGIVSAHSMKACTGQAVLQVIFTDVQKNNPTESCSSPGAQSFAPIALHKTDAASDWLFIKQPCIGTKGLPGAQMQN